MRLFRFCIVLSLSFILTACGAAPMVVNVKDGNEAMMNCNQLQSEIERARNLKTAARAEDKFKMSYMNPFNGIYSAIQINRAESAALKREGYLQQIYDSKGCQAALSNYHPAYIQQGVDRVERPSYVGYSQTEPQRRFWSY